MSYPNQGPSSTLNPAQMNNPSLANANSQTSNTSNMSLNPAQLAQLTDFHRQQAQLQLQARPTPSSAAVPAAMTISLPDHIRQGIAALGQGPAKDEFLSRYFKTDEGRQKLELFNLQKQQQQAAMRQQPAARTSSDLPPDNSPRATHAALPTTQTQATGASSSNHNQTNPLVPVTKAFDPATYTRPAPGSLAPAATTSDYQYPGQGPHNNRYAPPNLGSLPYGERERERDRMQAAGAHWQGASVYTPYRRATSPDRGGGSRRREDGMRGTMRSERKPH